MFQNIGIIDNDPDFFNICSFDSDNNCKNYNDALFEAVDRVIIDNKIKAVLSYFIMELKDLYTEVGFNLGCFFIERHLNKEFNINSCDKNKIEMKKILNLNVYLDAIFNRMWDIRLKNDFENIFSDMENKISFMKRELIHESVLTEEATNIVINSDELSKLSYFLIKTGFKCGVFIYFAYKTLHLQLSEEPGNYLPGDWPEHVMS
jgi:hypothetical protein